MAIIVGVLSVVAKLAKRTKSTIKAIFSRSKDASAIEVDDEDMPTEDLRLDGVFRWVQTSFIAFQTKHK